MSRAERTNPPQMEHPGLPALAFFEELLADRAALVDELGPMSLHAYETNGYQGHLFTVPEYLFPYLPSWHSGAIEAQANMSYTKDPANGVNVSRLEIVPKDSPSVTLKNQGFLTTVHIGGGSEPTDMFPGDGAIPDTLRCFLPRRELESSVDTAQITDVMTLLSPETVHQMEVDDAMHRGFFHVTEDETVDDSRYSMSIAVDWRHKSGKFITLTSMVTESLKRAMTDFDAQRHVLLTTTQPDIQIGQTVNGQPIEITHPTRFHTQRFREFVERLMDRALGY